MKTELELIAENSKLHIEIAMKIIEIQTLKNEVDQLKKKNEDLKK